MRNFLLFLLCLVAIGCPTATVRPSPTAEVVSQWIVQAVAVSSDTPELIGARLTYRFTLYDDDVFCVEYPLGSNCSFYFEAVDGTISSTHSNNILTTNAFEFDVTESQLSGTMVITVIFSGYRTTYELTGTPAAKVNGDFPHVDYLPSTDSEDTIESVNAAIGAPS